MAKKPKTSKDTQRRIDDFRSLVGYGKTAVKDILGKNFSLGRVDESMSPDELAIIKAAADEYAGSGKLDPSQIKSLGGLEDLATTAGTRSADTTDVINRARSFSDSSGLISPDIALALQKMREGLSGLSSTENTALYEQLTNEAKRSFGGAARVAAGRAGVSGVRDPSYMRTLANDYLRAKMEGAQKVLLSNVDVQDKRLGDFAGYSRNIASDVFGRQKDALSLYGDQVGNAETNEFNQKLASRQAYNSGVEASRFNLNNDRAQRLANWSSSVNTARTQQLNRSTTNMNTLASEIATKIGIVLGIPQYIMGDRAADEANKIAREAVNASKGGGSSGGSTGSTTPVVQTTQNTDSFGTPSTPPTGGYAAPGTVSSINNQGRL